MPQVRSPFLIQFGALVIIITTTIVACETNSSAWDAIKNFGLNLKGKADGFIEGQKWIPDNSSQKLDDFLDTLRESTNGTLDSFFSIMTTFSESSIPSSLAVVKLFPSKFRLLSGSYLSRSTAFGIRGALGWLIRCDKPHGGADFHHINYNPAYSGMPDPHYKVPGGVVSCSGGVTTLNKWFGGVITLVAVTADVYLVGETAVKEYEETGSLGQETLKSFVIVGSRWFGAFVGATLGNFLGSLVCTLLCCGNPIGEAIGSIVGYISGGIVGGMLLDDYVHTVMNGDVEYDMLVNYSIMGAVFLTCYALLTCICNAL